MKIVIKQVKSDFKNKFEVFVNNEKTYLASTPVISFAGPGIDKKSPIKITDLKKKVLFTSEYNFISSLKEEFIPFGFLTGKEQKFDQFIFKDSNNKEECQIYFSLEELLKGNYFIKKSNKIFSCYAKNEGYYKYVSIYDGENQIAQLVKLNVIVDANDEYTIFLKDEYNYLQNSLVEFTLYLDRLYFNYGFQKKSTYIKYSTVRSKNDDKYNPNWLKENFDVKEFNNKNEEVINKTKNKVGKWLVITALIILFIVLLVSLLVVFLNNKYN